MNTPAKPRNKVCALRKPAMPPRSRLPKATLEARDEALRLAYDETAPGARTRLELLRMLHS